MGLIADLRAGTAQAHTSLETRLRLFERIATPTGRREVVTRFYGLHAGLEAALQPYLVDWPALEFETRLRSPHLARDVRALGGAPEAVELRPAPQLSSAAEALGVFYVLEGSTLGGAVIEKQLKGAGSSLEGLSFLHPYGDQTGARWRAFMAVLEAVPENQGAEVVDGAKRGFAWVQDWLCGEGVAA